MASSPETPEPHRFWIVRFGWTVPLICGALVGVAFRLFFLVRQANRITP
jgi:hypothetical protein